MGQGSRKSTPQRASKEFKIGRWEDNEGQLFRGRSDGRSSFLRPGGAVAPPSPLLSLPEGFFGHSSNGFVAILSVWTSCPRAINRDSTVTQEGAARVKLWI